MKKEDRKEYRKQYYSDNKEKYANNNRQWYAKNKDKRRAYIDKNRGRIKLRDAARHKAEVTNPVKWGVLAVRRIRDRCKRKGILFALVPEDIVIPKLCPIFGTPIILGGGVNHPDGPSVDRRIPNLGYISGNIDVVSFRANLLKSDCTDSNDLRKVADWMDSRQKNQNPPDGMLTFC